jgi:putative ABC transport system ATP-binding protein
LSDGVPVLAFDRVAKNFAGPQGAVAVLREAQLALAEGEFAALTGPSGSGKSTCLHLAALLDRPSAGRVMVDGIDTSFLAEPELCALRARKIGMVFQRYCLLPQRSVFDNVLFRFRYLEHSRKQAEARVRDVLAALGLGKAAHRAARLLSGGEMQRVAIARAVVLKPRILIADEPTGNLDRASAAAVMDCFQALNAEGITILMATHNPALLSSCTRHIRLDEGVMAAGGAA